MRLTYFYGDEKSGSSRGEKFLLGLIIFCFVFMAYLFAVIIYETWFTQRLPTDNAQQAEEISDMYLPHYKLIQPIFGLQDKPKSLQDFDGDVMAWGDYWLNRSTYLIEEKKQLELDGDNDTLLLESNEGNMTAEDFDLAGKVVKVVDGDTIDIESGERIRLAIANTPERGQEGYKEATQFTKELCLNKEALVDIDDGQEKSYNRIVGAVFCDGGQFLNKLLIEEGHAVIASKFCKVSEFKEVLCDNEQL